MKKERTENRGSKAATGTKVGGYQSHCTTSLLLDIRTRTLCVAFQPVHIYLARPYGAKKNFYELFTYTLPTQAQRYIPLIYVRLNMSSFKLITKNEPSFQILFLDVLKIEIDSYFKLKDFATHYTSSPKL